MHEGTATIRERVFAEAAGLCFRRSVSRYSGEKAVMAADVKTRYTEKEFPVKLRLRAHFSTQSQSTMNPLMLGTQFFGP
jgi:hypothetical protein